MMKAHRVVTTETHLDCTSLLTTATITTMPHTAHMLDMTGDSTEDMVAMTVAAAKLRSC
jgi:hypothetical protein